MRLDWNEAIGEWPGNEVRGECHWNEARLEHWYETIGEWE